MSEANDPKLKLAMARLLPDHVSIRDNEVLGEHFAWKGAPPNDAIGETEWLYVMHLVEQTFLSTADPEERSRWFIEMQNLEWCGVTATFNQRAEAMCRVKGIAL
jgi:hypothetical protein